MAALMMPVDYHIHTRLCGHACGKMEEYIEHAIGLGIREMGFSDHLPLLHLTDEDPEELNYAMPLKVLPHYVDRVLRLKDHYSRYISIKLGIEVDYVPGWEGKTGLLLSQYPFDYVLGSVHCLGQWILDDPRCRKNFHSSSLWQLYIDYFNLISRAASSQLFDIIAHPDFIKKLNYQPQSDLKPIYERTAEVFASNDVGFEINTGGLRHPVNEPYPSLRFIKVLVKNGVPYTLGSDAHRPRDVARGFEQLKEELAGIGGVQVKYRKRKKLEMKGSLQDGKG